MKNSGILIAIAVFAILSLLGCQPSTTPQSLTPTPQSSPTAVASPTMEAIPAAVEEVQLTRFAAMQEGQITEESGAASHPTWSPNGEQIAFDLTEVMEGRTRETIWVVRSDGSEAERLLTPPDFDYVRDVAWSPDGQWLAFYLGGEEGIDIWVYRADGAGLRRLITSSDPLSIYTVEPAWSPDGTQIAYTQQVVTPRPEGHGFTTENTVWIMNADGGNPQQITPGEVPAWSPDGDLMAFVRTVEEPEYQRQVWVRDLSNGDERMLGSGYEPAWSPDGKWMALVDTSFREQVVKTKDDGSPLLTVRYASQEIFLMRSDGSDRYQLTNHPPEEVSEDILPREVAEPMVYILESKLADWSPAWSPDGKSIVFAREDSEKGEFNLWLLRLSFE